LKKSLSGHRRVPVSPAKNIAPAVESIEVSHQTRSPAKYATCIALSIIFVSRGCELRGNKGSALSLHCFSKEIDKYRLYDC